ncbi:uncharacterized protein LOC134223563 [Armigeres subalbatus]|uniref:uncharacterized protein LOC134223563 n=1 Tax=Armigeres subalbatus TaxID=124917 RepID=UPI002ED3635D
MMTTATQICVGNVVIMAQRSQVRISKATTQWRGPNVLITREERASGMNDDMSTPGDEPPTGDVTSSPLASGEVEEEQAPKGGRKRKRRTSESRRVVELRRSKRPRKEHRSADYHYD